MKRQALLLTIIASKGTSSITTGVGTSKISSSQLIAMDGENVKGKTPKHGRKVWQACGDQYSGGLRTEDRQTQPDLGLGNRQ